VRGRVLDVGGGTGGISFGLASHDDFRAVWLDLVPNRETRVMRERTQLDVVEVSGSGEALPSALVRPNACPPRMPPPAKTEVQAFAQ